MLRISIAIVAVMLLGAAALKPAVPVSVTLPQYGFSIDLLDAKPTAEASVTPLITLLPATEGFAPNINVTIQPFFGNIDGYIATSRAQFKEMNATIVSQNKRGNDEWTVEYKAQMQGNNLHFYARAISRENLVYLTTATAKESQWKPIAKTLRSHVDSFKMNQPAKAKAADTLD